MIPSGLFPVWLEALLPHFADPEVVQVGAELSTLGDFPSALVPAGVGLGGGRIVSGHARQSRGAQCVDR